jgi:glycosyltransferase involved in cell wall biosynthesis
VGRFAARAARSPIIVHTLHGSTFHEHLDRLRYGLYWSLEKLTARFTDRIISVGEDLQQRYLDAGIGKPSQYQVIRSGMDLHRFQAAAELSTEARAAIKRSLGVPENAPLVGKVARLEARKGYHYFLELAASVLKARPDAHFVGIGAGELQETLRQQAQSQGIGDRVHFVGFRSDIADVLASLDVIVLTSLWEGLPRVLVQAAVCGTPAVTFAVEGAWEVVKEGQNGYIVPSRDTQAMSRRVLELLADPVRAREMGQTGRRLVHEGWTIESMVSAISTVYDELARLKRLPGATR